MNTIKVIIPLAEILSKLAPECPAGQVQSVVKWEGNAVVVVACAAVDHRLPHPMTLETWLALQPAKVEATPEQEATEEPAAEEPAVDAPVETKIVARRARKAAVEGRQA